MSAHYFSWFQILSWLFLLLLLFSGVYALWNIRAEKDIYLKNRINHSMGPFIFPVPHWWGLKIEENFKKVFVRTDSAYDWTCVIHWSPVMHRNLSEILSSYLEEKKIVFDQPTFSQEIPSAEQGMVEFLRVEGTATEDQEKRIYLDLVLVRSESSAGYLMLENKSAVLHGFVEEPYFELLLKNLKINHA